MMQTFRSKDRILQIAARILLSDVVMFALYWPLGVWFLFYCFLPFTRKFFGDIVSGDLPDYLIAFEVILIATFAIMYLVAYFVHLDKNYIKQGGSLERMNKITYALILYLFAATSAVCLFAFIYSEKGLQENNGPIKTLAPGIAFYFSITTWTTVNYGEYSPSMAARPYAAMEGYISICFMAISLGQITNLIGVSTKEKLPENNN